MYNNQNQSTASVFVFGAIVSMLAVTILLSLSGCKSLLEGGVDDLADKIKDKIEDARAEKEEAEEQESESEPEQPEEREERDNNTFLWKPASESRGGRVAVLIPARIPTDNITINGQAPAENRGDTNGNRDTYFGHKPGSAYGRGVVVIAFMDGEAVARWVIPDGAMRFEKR